MEAALGLFLMYWFHQWGFLRGRYKVAAFCFGCLYWFHQWGIPDRSCRFYLFLAGAVGKRQGICESPIPLQHLS